MSSPITSARLAVQAASIATRVASGVASEVASGVQKAIGGFEQILTDPSSNDASQEPQTLENRIDQVADAIRSQLAAMGISVNPPIELSVHKNGSVRLSSNHPRAAEIETAITGNESIMGQLGKIRSLSDVDRVVVSQQDFPHA
ncbi:hypothetical protein CA13_53650 [Planctomycetes bacterium CA13]|uniref:Uncharacterized protein n=1 Tax=Novipirellula herctigrandis TaxID=2527986 RepID=A0A5C5ZAQ1_9BACT|nr:hypothetical protein CA13_53650 [Planctomycetes bacterium CA13]